LIKIDVDTDALAAFAKRLENVEKLTKPILALGLNEIGDGLVSVMATDLVKQTGLGLEEVRGMIKISRANRSSLSYDITIKPELLQAQRGRPLEAKRTDWDFGRRQPGELVIVVTQKDDLVCKDCQELEAAGPMPIEIAREHVPKHPSCRCVLLPYVQKGKRLPLTMTTLTGTDPALRSKLSSSTEQDMTLRQLAQNVMNKTANKIRVEVK
jgi:hypothetical protein